jgi:hypothetical protein
MALKWRPVQMQRTLPEIRVFSISLLMVSANDIHYLLLSFTEVKSLSRLCEMKPG